MCVLIRCEKSVDKAQQPQRCGRITPVYLWSEFVDKICVRVCVLRRCVEKESVDRCMDNTYALFNGSLLIFAYLIH